MELTLKQKQDKAKRDQKTMAAVLAGAAVILAYISGIMGWVMISMVYAGVVISVIFAELIDEAWVAARFQEYLNSVPEELESPTIDVIS